MCLYPIYKMLHTIQNSFATHANPKCALFKFSVQCRQIGGYSRDPNRWGWVMNVNMGVKKWVKQYFKIKDYC